MPGKVEFQELRVSAVCGNTSLTLFKAIKKGAFKNVAIIINIIIILFY